MPAARRRAEPQGACSMHVRTVSSAAVAAGVLAVAFGGAAAADPPKTLPAATPAALATGKPPAGYKIVSSAQLLAPAAHQTRGSVTCPAGRVPLGGGVFVVSGDFRASVNSSFPTFNGWTADVNNASGADTTFNVVVVCAKQPKNYSI